MKKIFPLKFLALIAILVFTVSISNAAYALTFYTQSFNGFFQNNIPSSLNTVNIQADNSGEITAANGLAIIIPDTLKLTFDIKNRGIKFSGKALAKVDVDNYKYSNDGKILYLPVKEDFVKDDVVSMDNVVVRIYQLSTGYEQLGIDTNNDGKIDKLDSNFVRIDQSDVQADVTPPYEVTKFTAKIVDGKTILNWVWPPDLDFYKLDITNNDTSEKQTIYVQSQSELTLPTTSKKGFSAIVYDLQGLSSKSVDATDVTPAPVVETKPTTDTTTTTDNQTTNQTAQSPKPEFTDIETHWSKDIVISMAEKGIIKGYDDKTFRPDNKITRAEAAAILYRVLGLAEPTLPADTGFKDVKKDAWYAGYVLELKTRQITKGYGDNSFKPDAEITRGEFLQLAINTLLNNSSVEKQTELKSILEGTITSKFFDLKSTDWYAKVVTLGSEKSYVEGQTCGANRCFYGKNSITRAEAAAILFKIFK